MPSQLAWKLPDLAEIELAYSAFDPALLDSQDFERFQIPEPRGVAKRKAEFLCGRLCARQALLNLTGTASTPTRGADRAPQWPQGIVGSITHSGQQAAAIVAHQRHWQSLGLDLEQCLAVERAQSLSREILTPHEQRLLPPDPSTQAFFITLCFSLKESLYKALYPLVGRSFYFQDAEWVVLPAQGKAQLRLLTHLSPEWPQGSLVEGFYQQQESHLLSLIPVPHSTISSG